MAVTLRLTGDDARLVHLALVYHLGRPGAEIDASTMQVAEHGLSEVKDALGAGVGSAATLTLDDDQHRKLRSAMFGCVNELRVYHMRNGAASLIPEFNETACRLFPSMAADPETALGVAESMIMLCRRLGRPVAGVPEPAKRRGWPFRR